MTKYLNSLVFYIVTNHIALCFDRHPSLQSAINEGNKSKDKEMKSFWKHFNIDERLPFKKHDKDVPLMRQPMSGQSNGFSFIMEFDDSDVACKQQNTFSYYVSILLNFTKCIYDTNLICCLSWT